MALSSDDFMSLKLSIQDLTKATQDLVLQHTRPGGTGGPVGPGGGLTGGAPSGLTATPKGAPSGDSIQSAGIGLSATRNMLGASGGGAAGAAGASGSGVSAAGALGVIGFGANLFGQGMNAIREASRPFDSAMRAFENAPLLDSPDRAQRRALFAFKEEEIHTESRAMQDEEIAAGTRPGNEMVRAQRVRTIKQTEEREFGPQDRARSRTLSEMGPFMAMGGMNTPAGQSMFLQRLELNRHFEEQRQQGIQKAAEIMSRRTSTSSPSSGSEDKK